MKRSALITVILLFTSGLIGIATPSYGADVPKTLTTCSTIKSGVLRILIKGDCNKATEVKGNWSVLVGSATTKVIFTCTNSKTGVTSIAPLSMCNTNTNGLHAAWTRSGKATSLDITDALCAKTGSCIVGDIGPGGGMIFYVAPSAQSWGKYFEAANPKAWQAAVPNQFGQKSDAELAWCDDAKTIVGAVGSAIGTGALNTERMVAKCKSGAAASAHAFREGGKSDWFLPSKDELLQMIQNLRFVYGFFPDNYWASTEFDATDAWYRKVTYEALNHTSKWTVYYVRPVRAF